MGQLPVTVCSNPDCEKPIFQGDQAWKKGNDLFCKLKCLADSFKNKEDNIHG